MNLQIKTSDQTAEKFNELIEKTACGTRSELLEKLLEKFINPGLNSEPSEADQELIKTLTLNVEELTAKISENEANYKEIIKECEEVIAAIPDHAIIAANNSVVDAIHFLDKENEELNQKLSAASLIVVKSDVEISLTRLENHLLEETCKAESKRVGKLITPDGLLKEMFMSYTFKGTHDHYPLVFSNSQLRSIVQQFKAA